jgi:hypothetical protein
MKRKCGENGEKIRRRDDDRKLKVNATAFVCDIFEGAETFLTPKLPFACDKHNMLNRIFYYKIIPTFQNSSLRQYLYND